MQPVKRRGHNFVYRGPSPDIADLSCYRERGEVWSHWRPDAEELELLNAGGDLALGLFAEPIPPIAMGVVEAEEQEEDADRKVVNLDERR